MHPVAMGGRQGMRLAKAKFIELCGASLSSKAFKLIHG
jgi:hypothetical protein